MSQFKLIAIIPVYNHAQFVEAVIDELQRYKLPVLMMDDGSNEQDAALLAELAQRKENVFLERLPVNQGKGIAVMQGFRVAAQKGYTHAIQVDADGQHDVAAVERFEAAARERPEAVINGCPVWDASAPKKRLFGRKVCQFWVNLNTLSHRIKDSQCGFRLYPLAATLPVIETMPEARRMEFDIEMIIRLDWAGVPIVNLPVAVHYPENGVSNYREVLDNLRIVRMHLKLLVGMFKRRHELRQRRMQAAET